MIDSADQKREAAMQLSGHVNPASVRLLYSLMQCTCRPPFSTFSYVRLWVLKPWCPSTSSDLHEAYDSCPIWPMRVSAPWIESLDTAQPAP